MPNTCSILVNCISEFTVSPLIHATDLGLVSLLQSDLIHKAIVRKGKRRAICAGFISLEKKQDINAQNKWRHVHNF